MTFADIQAAILNAAKTTEVCDKYQDILLAATEQDIIDAGLDLFEWAYLSGVVSDDLIAEFDQSNLNANNIYFTGSHTVTSPTTPVYILGTAEVTVNLSGSDRCKITALKGSVLNLNAADQSYAAVKSTGAEVIAVLTGDAIMCMEIRDNLTSTITTSDNTVVHVRVFNDVEITLESNNDAYIKVMGFFNSIINGTNNDASIIDVTLNQNSVYNGPAL